jgi:NAD(P)-dependent dehydrogenase (short-subunit alcohol dehydrogenase family)
MPSVADRAAIVTGASTGIGLAIARLLGEEGHALTVNSRRPERIGAAVAELQAAGLEVQGVAGDVGDEAVVQRVVAEHRERYGRLDVLVNNAGVGIGQPLAELSTKRMDVQLAANLRSTILFYREALELLTAAGAEHRNALVVNTASVAGKQGEAWLSVYSAAKAGVIAYTEAMNRELKDLGIKSTALAPAFVDTPMTDFVKEHVPADQMIQTQDIAEAVRMLLRLTPGCVIPELVFTAPGGALGLPS